MQIQATATGASGSIYLPPVGDFTVDFSSGGAFVLDLQSAPGESSGSFSDVYYDASTKLSIDSSTGPQSARVSGGRRYRMDVDTYNSAITAIFTPCESQR